VSGDKCQITGGVSAGGRCLGTNVRSPVVSRQGAGVWGQMSDHRWCHVCGDKISCPAWQLDSGCIEGYCPDNSPISLHSHVPAKYKHKARYKGVV